MGGFEEGLFFNVVDLDNSSCVYNIKFRKLSNVGLFRSLVIVWNMSQTLHCVKKIGLPL